MVMSLILFSFFYDKHTRKDEQQSWINEVSKQTHVSFVYVFNNLLEIFNLIARHISSEVISFIGWHAREVGRNGCC